jgi:hypothetical protein
MLTLELPWHADGRPRPEALPDDHLDTLRILWDTCPADYLAAVEGGVHGLLEAACRFDLFAGGRSR